MSARQHHDQRRARQCRPCQVQSRDEAGEDENKDDADERKQTAVELRRDTKFLFDDRVAQNISKTDAQDDVIDRQSDDGDRSERCGELRKSNVREVSDDHVLRIAHERRDAADVSAGREGDQVRQHRKFSAPDHRDDERR